MSHAHGQLGPIRGLVVLLAVWLGPGCLFDAGSVCGPHQHEGPMGTCLCDKGYVADGGSICRKVKSSPAALGKACDATSAPCTDDKYDTCHVVDGTAGYCTNVDCKSNDDCDGEHYCDDGESPSYCKRPPTGVGETCTTSADCADFDASYCLVNPVQSSCLVADCTSNDDCAPGTTCEDYSSVLPGTPKVCIPPM